MDRCGCHPARSVWRSGVCGRPLLFWRPEHVLSSWQVIEAGVKVGENKAPAVFADIQKGGANLEKTETNDKSAPVIEAGAKIGEAPQSALFAEIVDRPWRARAHTRDCR